MSSARIFGVLAVVSACAAKPAQPVAATPKPADVLAISHFPDTAAQRVRSRKLDFPIDLALPDKPSWQISEGPAWLEAKHAASSSELALRTWRADRLVRIDDCSAQARLARPGIPVVRDDAVVEREPFTAPAGFDSQLVVGVEPTARGVLGYALVFGSSVGRCYAAVFTTRVAGAGAEQEVATRLRVVVDRILRRVRPRDIEQRAPRARLVAPPE